jgi:hypothetical protein
MMFGALRTQVYPLDTSDHQEIDESVMPGYDDNQNYNMILISILLWIVTFGRLDAADATAFLSRFTAAP